MMARKTVIYSLLGCVVFLLMVSCEFDDSGSCTNAYVEEVVAIHKTVNFAGKCFSKGTSDCPNVLVNNCVGGLSCFHETCQEVSCTTDADCSKFGVHATCQAYVLDGRNLGLWCKASQPSFGGASCDEGCLDNCTVGADCLLICCR